MSTDSRTFVQLRVMRRDDIPAGLRLCRSSHWNQVARDWELFLTLNPEGCRVAVNEIGEVVGSVATVRYGSAFSWVAMVLVDPAHRGAGIGRRLLEGALVLLDDVSIIRLDATPAGHGVYEHAGFREEYGLQRMQRAAHPLESLANSVRLMKDDDLEEVLKQDKEAFGANRRGLLDWFRSETPEYAWVTGHREIEGYLFGRHGYDFEHLGPLVARKETAARRLVTACLSAHRDRPFILDVPLLASWADWLGSLGFIVQRPFIRMCRGDERPPGRPDQMFAIAGPEFG